MSERDFFLTFLETRIEDFSRWCAEDFDEVIGALDRGQIIKDRGNKRWRAQRLESLLESRKSYKRLLR